MSTLNYTQNYWQIDSFFFLFNFIRPSEVYPLEESPGKHPEDFKSPLLANLEMWAGLLHLHGQGGLRLYAGSSFVLKAII